MPEKERPKRDIVDRLGDYMERNHANPEKKIGAGHVEGMFRAGLKELSQILPAFPDGVRPVEEPGIAGNLTPNEVLDGKGVEMPAAPQVTPMARDSAWREQRPAQPERSRGIGD